MANTINIADAAQVVVDAEKAALATIKTAIDTLDATLSSLLSAMPQNLSLDSNRIISNLRSSYSYTRNDLAQVIAKYEPAPMASIPAMPEGTGNV